MRRAKKRCNDNRSENIMEELIIFQNNLGRFIG